MTEVTTGWSGLPLNLCPKCRKERVIEQTSRKGNPRNDGKVFFKCMSCQKFIWEDDYKKELVKACKELEILRSENAQLKSIVANQQVQIEALVGNQEGYQLAPVLKCRIQTKLANLFSKRCYHGRFLIF